MKKLILLTSIVLLLSACTVPVEVKQIRTDLDALHRASTTVDQLNSKIDDLNKRIGE